MKSLNKFHVNNSISYGLVFLYSMLFSSIGIANVYVPNTFADPVIMTLDNATGKINGGSTISLRSALMAADNLGGTHTVNLSTGTYNLTQAIPNREITIGNTSQNITINGNGPANTIISNTLDADKDRILFINPLGTTNNVVTIVQGIKFQNGYLSSDPYGGAGICAGGGTGNFLSISNCVFDNNVLPANAFGGAAVCMQVSGSLTIDNSTFTNNVSNDADGGAVLFIIFNNPGYQGDLVVTHSTFTGNSVIFPGAGTSNGGALAFSGQGGIVGTFSVMISHNTFSNNSADGLGGAISANNSPNLSISQIHYNRFYNNTSAASALSSGLHFVESAGSVNAENNWWGCNTNPVGASSTAPCNQAGGDVAGGGSLDADPWLQLKVTASPNPICNTAAGLGNTSNVTASFLKNSSGTSIPVDSLSRLIGLPVAWTSTLGSLSAQQFSIQASGTATALFTSNGTGGVATVNAQVDNVPSSEATPARANITVNTIPTVTNPANAISCVGGTVMFISTITGTPAPTIVWNIGSTPLVNGLQASGSTVSGQGTNILTITNVQVGDAASNYNVVASNQCGTATSANASLSVNSVTGGTVGTDQTICSAGDPAAFTESVASTGSGALTYQWQSSTTNCSSGFGNIGGAMSTTYDPPVGLTVTTYYRRVTTSTLGGVPCTAFSNCITVTVNAVTGGTVGSDQTICTPADPAAFTQSVASTGSGTLTYQWQSSTTNCSAGFSDIGGANATTYDPPAGLLNTTFYRRVTTSTLGGFPCTANSNCITVTVNPNNTSTLTSAPGTDAQTVILMTPITTINYATTGATGAMFAGLPPGVSGNWAGNLVTINGSPTTTGVFNYTVTLTGGCGNITSMGSITVNPPCTPPSFSPCPGNVTVNTAPSTCAATVSYTASATGSPAPTYSYVFSGATMGSGSGTGSGSSFNKGITNVTITATNGCAPDATCSFTITVNDAELPKITCPASTTLNTNPGLCSATFSYSVNSSDNCPGQSNMQIAGLSSGSAFPKGVTTNTWKVTDASSNTASCSFTVTVNDNELPKITCPSNITDFAVTGVCGKVITYSVTASDNCPGVGTTLSSGLGSGQIFPVGVTTESWKATDAAGNTATCSFTITIIDNQNPIITGCPSNIVKNTDPGVCSTTATWVAPTASDNCPGVSFTSNFAPGSTFSKGVTTVNYTATDASNNKTTCTFTVTVNDNQLPVINGCPGNIAQNTDVNQCFATVNWVAPTATDNCMISSFTTNKNPGSTFNVGMTTVTYTATDMSGNTATCSFTVTVTDAQLPTINCPGNATRNTAAGVCKYTVSGTEFNATASDACGISTLLCTLSGATTGSGLATLNGVMLNKGITTALWKATDVNGNMNTCMFTIEVKDTELPTITCPPNLTVITLPGQCSVSGLILGNPTGVGDNCGMTTVTNNGLSSYPVGMTTVTWKVTDMSGNTATCNQKVTVTAYSCGTPIQVLHYDTTFNSAKVKWVAGKCGTAYELRIRKELSPGVWGPWSAWTPASGPGLLHQYTGLDANSFYNYQIRTICGMSTSAAINDWFHTLPVPFQGSIDSRVSNEKENNHLELPTNLVFVPNPANEFTTVLIEGFENHQKTVTMFDLYGKLVFSVRVEAKQNQLELDLQRLGVHTGVYLIRVSDTEKQKTAQLMIERN